MLKRLDATNWRSRLVAMGLTTLVFWLVVSAVDVWADGESWGHALGDEALLAALWGTFMFFVFGYWSKKDASRDKDG